MKFENHKAPKLTDQGNAAFALFGAVSSTNQGKFPKEFPYKPDDFKRADESDDSIFYEYPKFCYHIDESAVQALTNFYEKTFKNWDNPSILDICASHVSHFPLNIAETSDKRVGLGMNKTELSQNPQLTDYVQKDLNKDFKLPFDDCSFDIVTNVVSIEYLNKPI